MASTRRLRRPSPASPPMYFRRYAARTCPSGGGRVVSGELNAATERQLEPELQRRRVARRDRNPTQIEGIGAGHDQSAEAGAAAAEAGAANEASIRLGEVGQAAIGVREQIDRGCEVRFQLPASAEDFIIRFAVG